jgi:hypothetical protein
VKRTEHVLIKSESPYFPQFLLLNLETPSEGVASFWHPSGMHEIQNPGRRSSLRFDPRLPSLNPAG